jgi:hypothetical protein
MSIDWTAWTEDHSAANFLVIFPEFTNAGTALIETRIAMAEEQTETEVWGDLYHQGVAWLAAHLLCLAPGAQDMRLGPEGESLYGNQRKRLGVTVASGYRVALAGLHS